MSILSHMQMVGVDVMQKIETSLTPGLASVLLHLVHPYALKNLYTAVMNVKRFHDQVNQALPKTENAQLAKDALTDLFDSSGVVMAGLTPLLEELQKGAAQVAGTYESFLIRFYALNVYASRSG
jgi:hypothetical protein